MTCFGSDIYFVVGASGGVETLDLLHLSGPGIENGRASLVHLGRILDTFGRLVLDRLSVRQPDVRKEQRDDECGGRDGHPYDDEQSLRLVVRSGDGEAFRRTGDVRLDEGRRVLVSGRGEGRIGEILLELSGDFIGPDAYMVAKQNSMNGSTYCASELEHILRRTSTDGRTDTSRDIVHQQPSGRDSSHVYRADCPQRKNALMTARQTHVRASKRTAGRPGWGN